MNRKRDKSRNKSSDSTRNNNIPSINERLGKQMFRVESEMNAKKIFKNKSF